jgi:hypothetical protein
MLISDLPTTLAASELSAFSVSKVQITPDYPFVEFGTADISHAGQGFCVCIVLDETKATGCSA